uniref:PX domain-containing protein n=1 Tax=Paramormyrops kingsleyae TaxID=1676925 RepID=A0A3B3QS00_9TELE
MPKCSLPVYSHKDTCVSGPGGAPVPQHARIKGITVRRHSDVRCLTAKDAPDRLDIIFSRGKDRRRSHPELRVQQESCLAVVPFPQRLISRSLGPCRVDMKNPVKISIPRYVLRGQGKDEHYEFEVKITVLDETWAVFRRYSRFREMHKTLKMKYPELSSLEFPPKKLFGNRDERVVAERRSHLERYLKNFFQVMLDSRDSPLHAERSGFRLSKHAICEFSPFFRKGVFDYSSHGTG